MDHSQTDLPLHLFHHGENFKTYELMGAHPTIRDRKRGFVFRVWAPHASAVFVVGDFNAWGESHPMRRISDGGLFEGCVSADVFGEGSLYKFKLKTPHGDRFKADPYGTAMQTPPETATVYRDTAGHAWRDASWLAYRKKESKKPLFP